MMVTRSNTRASLAGLLIALALGAACSRAAPPPPQFPKHLILITVDTLRADRVGAYGYSRARTPTMDSLAIRAARFEHAYATAPITLPSHASIMTGRYPPGHGARHNGVLMDAKVPTIASVLSSAGFATGGFIGAFPLDRRFGINKGFETYSDHMPLGLQTRLADERPGYDVVNEAMEWIEAHRTKRMFLWVHLFEPHAPYGDPRAVRSLVDRYDDDVAEADNQIGRLIERLGSDASDAVIVVASDHGESFGEHGEITHSLFVYTTLRVPLIISGPDVPPRIIADHVSLVDVAPTVLTMLGVKPMDSDGIDLSPAFEGSSLPVRELYAESFAPLFDFGWSPLRSIRIGDLKFIDAPRPELYHLDRDPAETNDQAASEATRVAELRQKAQKYPAPSFANTSQDREVRNRLQSLGYIGSSARTLGERGERPDPKDRRALAAEMSRVATGELEGPEIEDSLRRIVREDPTNPQANQRLGYVLLGLNRCSEAIPLFTRAIAAYVPSVDAHLGLAQCQVMAHRIADAQKTLNEAARLEPGNPVVAANLGILFSDAGRRDEGIASFQRALQIDPDFHEARFNLARAYARAGRREDAAREAQELLNRMPVEAPQRGEVVRLLRAVQ